MASFGAMVGLSKSESRLWKNFAWLAPRAFAARRERRVLFTIIRLSDQGDSASVNAETSSYDSIERAAGFGLENVLSASVRRPIRCNLCGSLDPRRDAAHPE